MSPESPAWGAKGGGRWRQPRVGCPGGRFFLGQGASAAAQPRPPRPLPPPGERELGADPGARGEEEKGEARVCTRGGQGRESIASPEPAAGCHLQPLKEAPPEKMPSVASCRCSQEPERHLADWGASGAYVFIGLTLQCPRRRGRLQRPAGGKARRAPKASELHCFWSSHPQALLAPSPM